MECKLKESDINHLRRLLGWVSCEVGQSPDEMIDTLRKIAPTAGEVGEDVKARVVASLQKSDSVPKYVRAAVKALQKTIEPISGSIVDAEFVEQRAIQDQPATSSPQASA